MVTRTYKYRALLIGVADYHAPGVPALAEPLNEVELLAGALTDPPGGLFHQSDLEVLPWSQPVRSAASTMSRCWMMFDALNW